MTEPAGWSREAIRAAIQARGKRITDLSREHGLPAGGLSISLTRKQRWPKANLIVAEFIGVSLHELWPHWYPPEGYVDQNKARKTPAHVFERILDRVARGERLKRICREPGQPTHATFERYRKRTSEFATRFAAALGRRGGVVVKPEIFDQVLARLSAGESIVAICGEPGMPTNPVIYDRVRRDPGFAARYKAALGRRIGVKVTSDQVDELVTALKGGAPLTGQRVMSYATVARYRRIDERFAERISGLYIPNPRLTAAERAARAAARRDRLAPFAHREAFVRALRQDEVYAVVEAAVPRGLPPDMRDDVKSDLVVALLTGEVQPAGAAAAARRYMAAWNRTFMHHDRSFDADGFGIAGVLADRSFDVGETGIRVAQAGW